MFKSVYETRSRRGRNKGRGLIQRTFAYFLKYPSRLPGEYKRILEGEGAERAVCDYIAGMTDNYLLDVYHRLFIPRSWEVKGINFTD